MPHKMRHKKLKSSSEIARIAKRLRSQGKRIVFTNGCFDLIHPGHIQTLKQARGFGDVLMVGLNSDSSVRKLKGRSRPLIHQRGRAQVMEALECVDYVVIFNTATPEKLIQTIRPHILVKGSDWSQGRIVGEDFVKSYGGSLRRIRLVPGFSTTHLIQKLKS
jgi:rfaE bifunctional protein nucleotidyltransferase chain/domain